MSTCIICHKEKDERMVRCICAECEKSQRAAENRITIYQPYTPSSPVKDWFIDRAQWFIIFGIVFALIWIVWGNPFAPVHYETVKVLDKQLGTHNLMYVSLEVEGKRDLYGVVSSTDFAKLEEGKTQTIGLRGDRVVDVQCD